MSGFAKVTLVGNLGRDPEVKHTAGGTAVANLRVACSDKVKGKDGTYEERTEWVSLVCFGKTAENAGKYLSKGRQIYADGRLQTREWTDKEGQKRHTTEVVAFQILFLGSGDGQSNKASSDAQPSKSASGSDEPPPLSDDDVPF